MAAIHTCGLDPDELRVRDGEFKEAETPLETAWTFWYDKKTTDKKESDQYMEGLRQLGSFNTVEGFYRHYTYLLRPSELPRDHNILLFRKGYKPMWEEFPEGGCWIIRIKRKVAHNYVHRMWENLLLACIGEMFEMPDVVGCVLSTRLKDDVLSVWNLSNQAGYSQARFRIGEKLKDILDLDMNALIQYKDHMQSLQDYSTYRNAKNYMFAPSPSATPQQPVMDTPGFSSQGDYADLDGEMLPPAAFDTMLPPAAVDVSTRASCEESSATDDWGKPKASPLLSASRSPALSAHAAPWTPPTVTLPPPADSTTNRVGVRASPMLSAAAAPWYPPGTPRASEDSSVAPPAAKDGAAPKAEAKSWASIVGKKG